jgi:hypothetical protein
VDVRRPRVSVSSIWVPAGKCDSPVIQVGDFALLVAHPNQRGCRIRHHPELFLAITKNSFSLSFPRSLPQQSKNQQCLSNNQQNRSKDVVSVALPEGGLPI